jgi:putative endonuclease
MEKQYTVYILTNQNNRVLYIGSTSNLEIRVEQHKQKLIPGFTSRYNVNKLVYFEITNDAYAAVSRERQLKGWKRERKNRLVETLNPNWNDLLEIPPLRLA